MAWLARHVGEARQVQLVGDGDRLGRAVAVPGQNQVRLATARVVAIEGIGTESAAEFQYRCKSEGIGSPAQDSIFRFRMIEPGSAIDCSSWQAALSGG
jgi:hypothetical protein